ncbi:hypothetical protein PILCRDRAFT_98888 [Piloderma croceum F 1598]|uniref:Uncharacterized protein n=1 Tax=Piloderma croceum (strain F 1598) TaxID=765440 RepID=A0A0C3F6C4_PILCF|nr:hypothetical protein PILCRDRAFT_98888 [Piloderma croceum F 1598]
MSVKSFNALPQPRLSPSGLPNHWHFDLCFMALDPTPSHVLFLVQLDSGYIHSERLLLGISSRESGIAFFPESATEAAPEVSKALLHAFINSFGTHRFMLNPPPPFSLWKLTTEDPDLAKAIKEEFKKISGKALEIAHTAFDGFWKGLKSQISITGIIAAALTTPTSIMFRDFHPRTTTTCLGDDSDDDDDSIETMKAVGYVQRLSSSHPISVKMDPYNEGQNMMKEVQTIMELFKTKSSEVARKEADEGNTESAIDYALLLQFGINCTKSHSLSHLYLLKALSIPTSSCSTKSACHALLIKWYTKASNIIRSCYLHAAAHHANLSIKLSPGQVLCAAVLWFGYKTLELLSHTVVEPCVQYKTEEQAKAEVKRAKRANRYRCANVGCSVQADMGRMLAQCSGKCDPDQKPSYCSKDLISLLKDWKIHKPFCCPNAPCSVIINNDTPGFGATTKHRALSIPITSPDGTTRIFSSSTMNVEMLKEIKAHSKAGERRGVRGDDGEDG